MEHVIGLLESIDGPRTDKLDVTQLKYFDCDSGGECGQLERVTDASGLVTTFDAYDAHGRVKQMTAPNGLVTAYEYDLRGRLDKVTQTPPGGVARVTDIELDAAGLLDWVRDGSGAKLDYDFNDAQELREVEDDFGSRVNYAYDAAGNRAHEYRHDSADAQRLHTAYGHDERNRLKEVTRGADTTTYVHTGRGELETVTDPQTHVTRWRYDALGRVDTSWEAEGQLEVRETVYGSDVGDRPDLVKVTRAVEHGDAIQTSYVYDDLGNLVREVSADRGTLDYAHDDAGNLTVRTDARGQVARLGYDALDRLETVDYDGAPAESVVLSYHPSGPGAGRLATVSEASEATAFTYDAFGNVDTRSQQASGSAALLVDYDHDGADRLTRTVYPSGTVVHYARERADRRVSAVSIDGYGSLVSDIAYAPFGPPEAITFASGAAESRPVDEHYRLGALSAPGLSLDYLYDAAGNVEEVLDLADPGAGEDFGYDARDRLISASAPASYGARGYGYDANDNRLTLNFDETRPEFAPELEPAIRELRYNAAGRIAAVWQAGEQVGAYRYNWRGERVEKVAGGETRRYFYAEDGSLLAEADAAGQVVREYIWLEGRLIGLLEHGPQALEVYAVHVDHLGTPRTVSDASGAVVWRAHYAPFGLAVVEEDVDGDGAELTLNVRFPGQHYDAESGLHYNYQRYYDPSTGRYLRSDPIGLNGGVNTYAYVQGNPLRFTDPSGHDAVPIAFPDYQIATGLGPMGGLGHAGILLIDSQNGFTRYYEYGRYNFGDDDSCGCGGVRNRPVPNVSMGKDGKPTQDSLARTLAVISRRAGQNGRILGAYVPNKNFSAMDQYARGLMSRNQDPNRSPYSLFWNNCNTFVQDVLEAGSADTPWLIDPRPNSYIEELRDMYQPLEYPSQ